MPKRMLDDSLLSSPSVAALSPAAQDAFPRFILLADDFGCFDANSRVLVGKGWPLREDVTERKVAGWVSEMERSGMLFLWDEDGRRFGYLTGWHGEHGQKHRPEYDYETNPKGSKRRTPRPPGWLPGPSRFVPARESAGLRPGISRVPSPSRDPQFQSKSQSHPQSHSEASVQPQIVSLSLGGAGGRP
jgi:hypothetical protein